MWRVNVQETTEALLVLLLLRLVLLLLSGGSIGGTTGSSSRGSRGVSVRVGDTVLELLNLGPRDLGLDGDGEELLVGVDDGVNDRGQGGEVDGQGDGRDGGDGRGEGLEELLLTNVEDIGGEGLALVVDLSDTQTVGEGRDVEHVEQGGLGGTDLGAGLDELQVGGNLNGTTGNLGGDTEGLEEGGLAGFHTSVASGDPDIDGGDGTSTGRGGDTVGENLVTDFLEVAVGEDETDVATDVGEETLILGAVVDEGLEGTANLDFSVSRRKGETGGGGSCAYHGVLAHQDDTILAEGVTDLVHLLGGDIVDFDDENRLVLLQQALELVEVTGLVLLDPHFFLFLKVGCLRSKRFRVIKEFFVDVV